MSDAKQINFVAALGPRERRVVADVVPKRLNERVGCELGMVVRRLSQHARRVIERHGMTARFEERVRERERIARELHDTLLQGTQALLLSVHALSTRIRPDDPMRGILTDTLRRADAVMTQGRDRIQNLRAETGAAVDLAQSLANAWRDLGGQSELHIIVEGPSRELEPDTGDEISLIGREALTNALRHSKAKVIEVQIVFGDDKLRLCVRDDGVGLGKEILDAGSLAGHWGLSGMRERAQRISASLAIWSAPGAGTEIELIVPVASGSTYRSRAARPGASTATAENFSSWCGIWSLVIAKFVPGLSTVGPPVASAPKLSLPGFLAASAIGVALWAGTGVVAGWLMRDQVRVARDILTRHGNAGDVLMAVVVLAWFGWAFWRTRRFERLAAIAHIPPQELGRAMNSGTDPLLLDLRSPVIAAAAGPVEGALPVRLNDLTGVVGTRDPGSLIVTLCACPEDATAAQTARRLKEMGYTAAYPLRGGYASWRQ